MTDKDKKLKHKIFEFIINAQISTYTALYAPAEAVITISDFKIRFNEASKYQIRKCLKSLIAEGVIHYTSQGRPAIISCGEIPELVYEAAPPINGYALTSKGYQSPEWKNAYKAWEKSMEEY